MNKNMFWDKIDAYLQQEESEEEETTAAAEPETITPEEDEDITKPLCTESAEVL